jgi:hypothetical protein
MVKIQEHETFSSNIIAIDREYLSSFEAVNVNIERQVLQARQSGNIRNHR